MDRRGGAEVVVPPNRFLYLKGGDIMPKQNEPTTKFKVDISELKKQMQEAQRQIRLANSEFKAATAGMEKFEQSADGISAKLTQLHKVLDGQNKKLESLEKQYDAVVEAQGAESKGAQELLIQINNQKAAIGKCESEIQKYEGALDEVENASEDVQDSSDDATKGIKDIGEAAKDSESGLKGFAKTLGGVIAKGAKVAVAGVTALGTAFLASAESSREFRTNMSKIKTAFTDNGFTAKDASKQYKDFYAVLGDDGQATEAVNHLSKLCNNQKELADWTNITKGVYGTFGDSLPIEGLTEAANETAKVAQVTGPLADAINWATTDSNKWSEALSGNNKALAAFQKATKDGESAEDAFNAALGACKTEQERSALITNTLNSLYSDAAKTYEKTAGDIMDAQRAQAELNDAMAKVGTVAEPVMTAIKMTGASLINVLMPGIEKVGDGIKGLMNGATEAAKTIGKGLSTTITAIAGKIQEILPTVAEVGVSLVTTLASSIANMLPDLVQTAGQIVLSLINGITEALPDLLQSFTEAITGVVDSLIALTPRLITAAVQFFMALVNALPTIIPQLITGITNLIPQIVDVLTTAVPQLVTAIIDVLTTALPQIVTAIVAVLTTAVPQIVQGAITLLMGIVDALPTIIDALVAALPQIITAIVTVLTTAVPQIVQGAITLLMGIVDALPTIIDALVAALPQIITAVVTALTTAVPQIVQGAITLLMGLIDALPQIIITLTEALPQIVTTIVDSLINNADLIFDAGIQIFMGLVEAIPVIIVKLVAAIPKMITAIIGALLKIIPKLVELFTKIREKVMDFFWKIIKLGAEKGASFVLNIVNKIKELPGKIAERLAAVISKVIAFGISFVAKAKEAGSDFLNAIINRVKSLPGDLYDKIKGAVTKVMEWRNNLAEKGKEAAAKLVSSVVDNVKNLPGKIKDIGKNIVKGLWNGINGMTDWIKDRVSGFSKGVLNNIKGFFGIHSPSRVMRDQVGKYISLGIAEGIDKNKDAVTKATTNLGKKVLSTLEKTMSKKEFKKHGSDLVSKLTEGVNSKVTSFQKSIDAVTKKFDDAIKEVKSKRSEMKEALSGMGGDLYTKDDDGNIVLSDLKAQTKEVVAYGKNLNKLKGKISKNLMDEILGMDADEGYEYTQALLKLSDDELAAYNKAYTKKIKASEEVANAWYKKDLENLQSQYTQKVTKLVNNLVNGVSNAGKQAVNGFLKAFKNNKAVNKSLNDFCDNVLNTVKKKFKIHSPSKVMENMIGNNLVYGLAQGITRKTNVAVKAMKGLSDNVMKKATMGLNAFNSQIQESAGGKVGVQEARVVKNYYNFNQTNNSPKALSRWDIYRQSKNLLGGVENV